VHNHFGDPAFRAIQEELTGRIVNHTLSHSRVRSFGGGRHAPDIEREERFEIIRAKVAKDEYPGL
jgi:hypothetical protein